MLSDAIADNIGPLRDACENYLDTDESLDIYPGGGVHRTVTRHCLFMLKAVQEDLDNCGGNPYLQNQLWLLTTAICVERGVRRWSSLSCWYYWIRRGFLIRNMDDFKLWTVC